MNFKYTTTIILLLMILALSRGVVLHYQDFIHFDALIAHADDGDGGSSGGTGDSGSSGGTGDSGSSGGQGDSVTTPPGDTVVIPPVVTPVVTPPTYGGGTPPVTTCGAYSGTDGARPTGACLFNLTPGITQNGGTYTSTEVVSPSGYIGTDTWSCTDGIWAPVSYTCTPPAVSGACNMSAPNSCASGTLGSNAIQSNGDYHWYCDGTPNTDANRSSLCWYVPPSVTVYGCMDSNATNYKPSATVDDWSCTYPPAVVATCALTASPSAIQNGSSSTLSWATTDMDSSIYLSISNGIGSVSLPNGSRLVSPSVTTTYVGTIVKYGTSVSPSPYTPCTATITVTTLPPPPPVATCTLTANPTTIQEGDSSTLHWMTTDMDSSNYFSINQGIGTVSVPSGSQTVSPTVTTTYVGFIAKIGTSVSPSPYTPCTATITVTPFTPFVPLPVPATIKVVKVVVNDNGGTKVIADFPLFVDSTSPLSTTGVLSGVVNTFAPNTYTVSETNQPGYAASFSGDCDVTGHITISAGQEKVCTITNNDVAVPLVPATIKVVKVVVNDNGGTKVIADFPLFVDSTSPLSTTGVLSGVVNTFAPNTYTVSETNQPGYAASFSGDCDVTGHITVSAGQDKVCTLTNNDIATTVTVTPPTPPSGGGGGGGSHRALPVITLAALPHVGAQPLAYLYLSQIPQTGLDLGPVGTMVYWLVLIGIAFAFAYFVLFGAAPLANRSLRNFGSRVSLALNAQELAPVRETYAIPPAPVQHEMSQTFAEAPEAVRGYSSYDGFKSFAQNGALSIEDLVKGLSRERGALATKQAVPEMVPAPRVEPIYEYVEPIYQNVESIAPTTLAEKEGASASVRGFTSALLEGDRVAVFAGLRQHVRGSGAPEQLVSSVACLLDDVYRARIDGSACDPDIARMTARLNTPTLENLIASLTTAIDSSYSTGVTGVKLALTRALAVLGA